MSIYTYVKLADTFQIDFKIKTPWNTPIQPQENLSIRKPLREAPLIKY